MAGTGPADLHSLAEDYLQACVEALDTIPGDPNLAPGSVGAPERAYVTYGTPPAECDQLTVHITPLGVGAAAPLNAAVIRVNRVTLIATLFRCGPQWESIDQWPTPEIQEALAAQVNADRWALWNFVYNKWVAKLLFEECGDVLGWGLAELRPSGGVVGTTLTVTVSLQGYESVFGT
jgi:hypothetical protein